MYNNMIMTIIDFLIKELGKSVKSAKKSYDRVSPPEGIFILDGKSLPLDNHLFISDWQCFLKYINNKSIIPPATVFLSDSGTDHDIGRIIVPGCNIIETDLELPVLYNNINYALNKISKISNQYCDADFSGFLIDILSKKLHDYSDIAERTSILQHPIKKNRYHFVIIDFKNKQVLINNPAPLLNHLSNLFYESNITIYENKIVIVYPSDSIINKIPDELKKDLLEFLQENDAYASVSNGVKRIEMMSVIYSLTRNILKLGPSLSYNNDTRIFEQEAYSMYYVIDLCAKQFERLFHSNDIIYLTHPGIFALMRYDSKNNTNLLDVLFCYLMNNRNLSKTSKQLFLHRNTTLNRINKILEIINVNLDDGNVQSKLMFSFLLINYYRDYRKLPLHL